MMNALLTRLHFAVAPEYKNSVRIAQIRYQRLIRVIRAVLLPPALNREV